MAVEPDTGIITDCALTKANGADNHEAAVGLRLLETENSPVTVLADSAYGAGDFRAELADQGHIDRVKPAPNRRVIPGGFTIDDFTVDHAARSATCPNGLTRPIAAPDLPLLAPPARPARCAPDAPAVARARNSKSAPMTSGYVRPARLPVTRNGWPSTASTVPWSNAP